MISPLYLFMTFRLSTKSFHRRTVIDLAARLGPHKPPRIWAVESAIWDAIFRLAEGRISAYRVLCDLAKSLPWSDIEEASNCDADKQWFNPSLRTFVSLLEVHHPPNNMSCSHSNSICPYQILSATDWSIAIHWTIPTPYPDHNTSACTTHVLDGNHDAISSQFRCLQYSAATAATSTAVCLVSYDIFDHSIRSSQSRAPICPMPDIAQSSGC